MEPELKLSQEPQLFLRLLTEIGIRRNIVSTYNHWVDYGLKKSMNERLKWLKVAGQPPGSFNIENLTVHKPTHPLSTYRNRNGKYTGRVTLEISYQSPPVQGRVPAIQKVTVESGHIPIMIGSNKCWLYDEEASTRDGYPQVLPEEEILRLGECPNDAFGYFFVKGEKTLIMQEKLRVGFFLTYAADNKGTIESRITCVNSVNSTIVTIGSEPKLGSLIVGLNHLKKKKYPLFLVFKALGVEHTLATELILRFVEPAYHRKVRSRLVVTFEHYKPIMDTPFEAIAAIRDYKGNLSEYLATIEESIRVDLYSHIGSVEKKIVTLAYHVSRLLEYQIGIRSLDSRDDWGNKRIDSAGRSMEQLVIGMWNATIDKCQVELNTNLRESPIEVLQRTITNNKFTDEFISAFGNNAWGLKSGRSKENIVEQLRRDTPVAVISQIGRVNAPVSRHGQMRNIREVRGDQTGMLCLFETPEGEGCGIIKNVAMTCWPSIERSPRKIIEFILSQTEDILPLPTTTKTDYLQDIIDMDTTICTHPVFVNGVLICWANGPVLHRKLIAERRRMTFDFDICIYLNNKDRSVEIDTQGSRPTRPVLVVDETGELVIDKLKDGWSRKIDDLRRHGCIENIDAREQHQCFIAYSIDEFRRIKELRQLLISKVGAEKAAGIIGKPDELTEYRFALDIPKREFDYVELDPNVIFSMTTSHIPGANKQQGPRTTYQCVEENTPVLMSDGTQKAIRDIRDGDEITSIDPTTLKKVSTKIHSHFNIESKVKGGKMFRITTVSGRELTVTDDHQFLTDVGWVEAKSLNDSHKLGIYESDGCIFVSISNIEEVEHCRVCDFTTVADTHSFVANGFITHNCSMGKQALSQYHSNEGQRMDTSSKRLLQPARPIVEVETAGVLGLNRMPAGQTVTVAIMAHFDNPEDGIVMTREAASLANCFTICKNTTHTIIRRRDDLFRRPVTKENERAGKYHAIEDNGLPRLDAYLGRGDCLLGRVRDNPEEKRVENNSIFIGIGEEGFVDRITITNNDADTFSTIIKIKLRQIRHYKAGDKAASRYAQKGTMACIVERHTMPRVCETWTDEAGVVHRSPNAGVVPDILINPHSFPSRMTMNKMQEILVSKAALFTGERVNGTTFRQIDYEHFQKVLVDNHMRADGTEDMEIQTYKTDRESREKLYTGKWRKLKNPITFGVCYYQALRHHVDDKMQYRSRGAIRSITHQPVRGRSREGGIRFGEMERDAQISHGAAAILQERLCISSDRFTMPVCATCGRACIADYLPETKVKYTCNVCHGRDFGVVVIPYAFKLVCHMLQACCIDVKLNLRRLNDRLFA